MAYVVHYGCMAALHEDRGTLHFHYQASYLKHPHAHTHTPHEHTERLLN